MKRVVEDAQIGGRLQHPGIVPVHELGTLQDERPFLTMKLINGRTLATILAKHASAAAQRAPSSVTERTSEVNAGAPAAPAGKHGTPQDLW